METQFRSSFLKDVRKIKDRALLRRVQETIETVDQAGKLDEVLGIRKVKWRAGSIITESRWVIIEWGCGGR